MNLIDSIKLSLNSLTHRKLRAWLTLLGIIIGVAAVVSIVSIGEGLQANVSERFSGFGADIITVSPSFSSRASSFSGSFRGGGLHNDMESGSRTEGRVSLTEDEPVLTNRDSMILKSIPDVLYVNEIVSGRAEVSYLAEKATFSIQGVNPISWKNITNDELSSGRFLSQSDSTAVVIGSRIANDTFKQPLTIGRLIAVNEKSFTVVGILKESGGMFGGSDSTIFMPVRVAWTVLEDVTQNEYSSIQLKVSDTSPINETIEEVEQVLMFSRHVTERNKDFGVSSAQTIQERIGDITQAITLFLAAIAGVSLLVGAVGIANSMFTSVLEKTREIGILKALGSSNNEILRLFVIESGLFGLVGGIIGVVLGITVSVIISMLGVSLMGPGGTITTFVSPQLIIFAIVFSTLIGVVSGIIPARAASKLKPVEALRYE